MGDDITIGVTEIVNNIEVTAQPNDQIVDISVIDNADDVTLNITPTVIEINVNKGSSYAKWGTILGTLSDQTDLQNALDLKANLVGGKVPASELPSYVDDVVEVADYAALPTTGETGKIYVTLDNNKIYRWSGSVYIEIAANSAIWGAITGTLSSQTDLQNALNAKFDDPTGDTTQYIAGDGSLITFPIAGQSGTLVREVRNTTGATLLKGTVVYINGATGNKPTVAKAIATGDSTSAQTFGMLQADIANNANGYVVCVGDIIGLDTSAITEGTQLYLSSTTAGAYTSTKQLAPAHLVYIGVVTRSHPTLGQIEVKIQNGYELDEIHDVSITSKTNKDFLVYESATSLWKNKSLGTVLAGTSSQFVKGDGSLDSNTYALDSAVVKLSGAQTISGIKTFSNMPILSAASGVDGQIVYADASNQLKTITNFKYNDATGVLTTQLGSLGSNAYTSTAYQPLLTNPITGTGTTNYLPKFTGSTSLGNSQIFDNGSFVGIGVASGLNRTLQIVGTQISQKEAFSPNEFLIGQFDSAGNAAINNVANANLYFHTNNQRAMTILANLNVGIGVNTPAVNLHIKGSGSYSGIRVDNTGTTGGGYVALYQNGSQIGLFGVSGAVIGSTASDFAIFSETGKNIDFMTDGTTTPKMRINTSGNVGIGTTSPYSGSTLTLQESASLSSALSMKNRNSTQQWDLAVDAAAVDDKYLSFIDRTNSAVRMAIGANGNVGIGTTSPSYQLQLSTDSAAKPTSALWTIASDERIKENINSYTKGLNELLKINPITYDYNGLGGFKKGKGGVGIIAQEIAEILPDSVSSIKGKLNETDEEEIDILNFNGHELTYIIINAVKELKAEIELLKAK